MMELKLYEVVESGRNTRSQMGRVIIPPPTKTKLEPKQTGKIFLCCNRVFLAFDSFESHKRNDCKLVRGADAEKFSISETILQACNINKAKSDVPENDRKYSCTVLDATKLIKRRHLVSGLTSFECRKCRFSNSNLHKLVKHVEQTHTEESVHRREIIQDDATEFDDATETNYEPARVYKCDMCTVYETSYKSNIILHKQKAHVMGGAFHCAYCTCCYGTQVGLMLHLQRTHNRNLNKDGFNIKLEADEATHNQICNKHYGSKGESTLPIESTFVANDREHQITQPLDNQESVQIKEQGRERRIRFCKTEFSIFKCGFCPKLFDEKYQLILHHRAQHLLKVSEDSIDNHTNLDDEHRFVKKNVRCKFCERLFDTSWMLNHHESRCTSRETCSPSPVTSYISPVVRLGSERKETHKEGTEAKTGAIQLSGNNCLQVHDTTMNGVEWKNCVISRNQSTPSKNEECGKTNRNHCSLCGYYVGKDADELASHLKKSHVFFGVDCECGCSFATATELTNHINTNCPNQNTVESSADKTAITVKKELSSTSTHTCGCGKSFSTSRKLEKHTDLCKQPELSIKTETAHGELSVNSESGMMNSMTKTIKKQVNENPPKVVSCPFCEQSYKNETGLRIHKLAMHPHLSFKECEICKYRTNNYRVYTRHKKSCHVVGGIKCPQTNCLCSFKTKESLHQHLKMMHKQKLDYKLLEIKCNECDFVGYTEKDMEKHRLKGHKASVQEKKEFVCALCSYTATLAGHLAAHLKTNHVVGGIKCEFCNNSFSSELGVRAHTMMLHKKAAFTDKYKNCKLCGYHTGTEKNYKDHHKRCHVGPYRCPECVCSFRNIDGLSKHAQIMHKKKINRREYLLRCRFSNCEYSTYYNGNLRHHETTHDLVRETAIKNTNEIISCPICDREVRISSMENHLFRAHVEGGLPCPENCKCTFRTELGLSRHMVAIHGKRLDVKKERGRDATEYPIKCSRCDFRSKDANSLNKHCSKMHGFWTPLPKLKIECSICNVKISETLLSHIKRCHVQNGFKCLQTGCPCSFETFHSRATHMRKAHQLVSSKRCHICKFRILNTIEDHMKRCHVENGLKCKHVGCSCSFKTELGRQQHFQKRHVQGSTEKVKICQLCGCNLTETLAQHLKRAHVQNGLSCTLCSCSFATEQGRTKHIKRRHNIIMSANCTLCGNKPVVSMKLHIKKSHVPGGLPCNICGCSFATKMAQNRHLSRYHNFIAPKKCSFCNMVIKITMADHIRRHHVPDGYPCTRCNWSMLTKSGLALHFIKVHKERLVDTFSVKIKNISTPKPKKTPRACRICGRNVLEPMEKHIERNHSSINHFKCRYCCNKFSTKLGRTRHVSICHKILNGSTLSSPNPRTPLEQ